MNRNNSIKSLSMPLPSSCDFCDRKAQYAIIASQFVTRKSAFVCKEHDKMWHNNTLNI